MAVAECICLEAEKKKNKTEIEEEESKLHSFFYSFMFLFFSLRKIDKSICGLWANTYLYGAGENWTDSVKRMWGKREDIVNRRVQRSSLVI